MGRFKIPKEVFPPQHITASVQIDTDLELINHLSAMIKDGQASEFVIVVETPAGSRLSFMSKDGRKLAGWAYRKGAEQ